MYNQELKERYIKEKAVSPSTKYGLLRLFENTEKYEVEHGDDLCTMGETELQPLVDEIAGLKSSTSRSRIKLLKEYVAWCISEGVSGACDSINNVKNSAVEAMRQRTVQNPYGLKVYLDSIFDPESDNTLDLVYRCYFWLAYAGLKQSDVENIRDSDVDLIDGVIRFNGNEYIIYPEARQAFKKCVTLTHFSFKGRYSSASIARARMDSDILLRGFKANPSIRTMRRTIISRVEDATNKGLINKQLSYQTVQMSGIFYRMYLRETAGLPVNFYRVAEEYFGDKPYFSNGQDVTVKRLKTHANTYLEDYENWKGTIL